MADLLFSLTFDAIRASLFTEPSVSDLNYSGLITSSAVEESRNTSTYQLAEIRECRGLALACLQRNMSSSTRSYDMGSGEGKILFDAFQRYSKSLQLRFDRKIANTVFDIIGEYGKARSRLLRRRQLLSNQGCSEIAIAVSKACWKRFLLRLCAECTSMRFVGTRSEGKAEISFSVLSFDKDIAEVDLVSTAIRSQLVARSKCSSDNVAALRIVSISRLAKVDAQSVQSSQKSSAGHLHNNFLLASTAEELRGFARTLAQWVATGAADTSEGHATTVRGRKRSAGKDRDDHISNVQTAHYYTSSSAAAAVSDESHTTITGAGGLRDDNNNNNNNKAYITSTKAGRRGRDHRPLLLRLAEFVSSDEIAWMHLPSYFPSQFRLYLDRIAQNTSSLGTSGGGNSKEGDISEIEMRAFIARFVLQHSAVLFSNRLYFCLEERASLLQQQVEALQPADMLSERAHLKSEGSGGAEQSQFSNNYRSSRVVTALLRREDARRGGHNQRDASALSDKLLSKPTPSYEVSEVVESISAIDKCISHMQRLYVVPPPPTSQSGDHCVAAEDAGASIGSSAQFSHKLLGHGRFLVAQNFLEAHREAAGANDLASIYPDVVKCCVFGNRSSASIDSCGEGKLHFAAATTLNLLETDIALQVFGQGREKDQLQSGRGNDDNAKDEGEPAEAGNASQGGAELGRLFCLVRLTPNKIYMPANVDDYRMPGLNGGTLLMLPLSDDCTLELLRETMTGPILSSVLSSHPPPDVGDSMRASFLSLLPDAATRRGGHMEKQSLQHHYVLMNLTYEPSLLSSDSSESRSGDNSAIASSHPQRCYYLAQIRVPGAEEQSSRPLNNDDDEMLYQLLHRTRHSKSAVKSDDAVASHEVADTDIFLPAAVAAVVARAKESSPPKGAATPGGGGTTALSTRRWDPAVLSTLCRWLGCQREAVGYSPHFTNTGTVTARNDTGGSLLSSMHAVSSRANHLCQYHSELKHFMDFSLRFPQNKTTVAVGAGDNISNMNDMREIHALPSSKFLPKIRAPVFATVKSEAKKDLLMIRAASSLLQDFWEGKVAAEIKAGAKKAAQTLRPKYRMKNHYSDVMAAGRKASSTKGQQQNEFSTGSLVLLKKLLKMRVDSTGLPFLPQEPRWTVWRNDNVFISQLQCVEKAASDLEMILNLEREVTEEIAELSDLKVFPGVELAISKKDFKALRESLGSAVAADSIGGEGPVTAHKEDVDETTSFRAAVATAGAELLLCEKKLSMFRTRRLEEQELKEVALRRQARNKQLEQQQARDPANFGNQRF